MPPDPPNNFVTTQCYGATHAPARLVSIGNKPFLKDILKNAYPIYTYLI